MRIVVTGATGNVGTSLVEALSADPRVESVVGVARRLPDERLPNVEWRRADVASDDLAPHFWGADCVVHLAWLVQPSRDPDRLTRVNVHGSARVFSAAADAGVPALVHASSVGAYARGPKLRRVDERWPTTGIPTSLYSQHKAAVERRLDRFEAEHPEVRVARLRPALVSKRESATGQRRLSAGPFLPGAVVRSGLLPFVPDTPRLVLQAVHADDAADAYLRAALGDARGAFNVAAEPPVTPAVLATLLGTRTAPVPAQALRLGARVTWRLRLQPIPVGWVDMALGVPLLDTTRAREELGWEPRRTAAEAVAEALDGLRTGAGRAIPPLEPRSRLEEPATGVGARESPSGEKQEGRARARPS